MFMSILTLIMGIVSDITTMMDNIIVYNNISLLSILVGVFIAHFAITLLFRMYGTFNPDFSRVKSDSSLTKEEPKFTAQDEIMRNYRGY